MPPITSRVLLLVPLLLSVAASGTVAATPAPDGFLDAQRALAVGDVVGGERLLRDALAADPGYAPAHHELGLVRWFSGRDPEGARTELLLALSLGLPADDAARARYVLGEIASGEWRILAAAGGPPAAIEAFIARWPGSPPSAEARALLAASLATQVERSPSREGADGLLARFPDLAPVVTRMRLVLLHLRFTDLVRAGDADGLAALALEAAGTPLGAEADGAAFAARVWGALRGGDAPSLRLLLDDPRSGPHREAIAARLRELLPPPPVPVPAPPAGGLAESAPAPSPVAAVPPPAPCETACPFPPEVPPTELVVPVAGTTLALAVAAAEIRGAGLLKAATVFRPRVTLLVGNRGDAPVAGVTVRGTLTQGRGRVVEVVEADVPGPFDPPLPPGGEPRSTELAFTKGADAGRDRTVSFAVALELSDDGGGRWIPAGSVLLTGAAADPSNVAVTATLRATPPAAVP